MKQQIHCTTCGVLVTQAERGRQRLYCSDACRRAADSERKASRPKSEKPTICALCGGSIIQPATGRPRRTCTACHAPQKLAQKATGAFAQL